MEQYLYQTLKDTAYFLIDIALSLYLVSISVSGFVKEGFTPETILTAVFAAGLISVLQHSGRKNLKESVKNLVSKFHEETQK